MRPHLTTETFRWDDSLTWYQSLADPTVTSSNLATSILFDKNQVQGNVSLCKFQAQKAFTWGVLENNINHILSLHLIAQAFRWDDSLTIYRLIKQSKRIKLKTSMNRTQA